MTERILPYDRNVVPQELPYDCGPASAQVVLNGRGITASENDLIREIGTTVNGTDYVGLIERVLDVRIPDARYTSVYIDHDPATPAEKEALWRNLVRSIDGGFGVVMNWVSPPGNHPVGIKGSATPNYRGTIWHYVAAMGYDDTPGQRAVWIADPGFRPFGYWVSFDQCATLIPPKGYAFADVGVTAPPITAAPVDDGADVLARAMGGQVSFDRYRQLLPAVRAALVESECNTVDRIAMWCAQIGHESGGLRWMEEIASGDAYDTRTDLGNTPQVDGDGRLYKGRGPIQVTGKNNYRALSIWANDRNLVPTRTFFLDNPTELASDRYGFTGAIWYWTAARPMNSYADRADIRGATLAVNGGDHGLDDRTARWNRCRAMGNQLLQLITPAADPFEELLMSGLSVPSMSIYADPDEPDVPLPVMIQGLDAHGPHEPWVEAQARLGDPKETARVVRTAMGKGKFGDLPRAVNQATRVLAEIEGVTFEQMKRQIQTGALA